jgi:N-acetyltransferase
VPRSLAVTLSGPNATLTPLSLDDAPGLLAAAMEDRRSYGFTSVPDTEAGMLAAVRSLLAGRDAHVAVPFATRASATGRIVGMTRFLSVRWWFGRDAPDAVEIGGTFLAASAQRTRINTEAKLLMLGHAFDVWGVQRVDFKTDERNERSRRAIERLGARLEGVLRGWQPSLVNHTLL